MKKFVYSCIALAFAISAGAQSIVTLGTGTAVASGTTNYQGPVYRSSASSSMNFSRHRILYLESDLAAIGILPGMDILQIGWDKVNSGAITPGRSATFKLYMKKSTNTTLNSESWNEAINGAVPVLICDTFTNVPASTGYWMIDFDFPFVYTGGSIELFTDWAVNPGPGFATTNDFQLRCTAVSGYRASAGAASSAPLSGSAILSTTAAGAGVRYPNTRFTVVPSSATLPVKFSKFSGERVGSINKLSWTTQSEQNNKGFEIQRSLDGNSFSSIGFIASKANGGNSSSFISYEFNDQKPFSGNGYYRLKQIDNDGKQMFSQVVLIKGGKVSKVEITKVFPNPTVNNINVLISSPLNSKAELTVLDISGKVIIRQDKLLNAGENYALVNVSFLAPGTYFLRATGNETNEIVKFSKY